MTAWGAVRLADADALPGYYYVSVRDGGRTCLALGPFTQTRPGRDAHARALGYVELVRRHVHELGYREAPFAGYGTSRLPITSAPAPAGRFNAALLPRKEASSCA